MKIILLLFFVVDASIIFEVPNFRTCPLPGGKTGFCRHFNDCPSAILDFQQWTKRPQLCRFEGFTPIVCCDEETGEIENNAIIPTQESGLDDRQQNTNRPQENKPALGDRSKDVNNTNPAPEKPKYDINNPVPLVGKAGRFCQQYYDYARNNYENNTDECNKIYVFGGKPADLGAFSHMVRLGTGEAVDSIDWKCGGSLISEQYVLTAAHCTRLSDWALLGVVNLEDVIPSRLLQRIVEKIRHPEYKAPFAYHDIALLKLERPVEFNKYVRPHCLSTRKSVLKSDDFWCCGAAGWGKTEKSGDEQSVALLKVGPLPPQTFETCKQIYSNVPTKVPNGINDEIMFCAGGEIKDTCQGDSGGPLMTLINDQCFMFEITGVTSFGKPCGTAPGVYTRISYYVPWIESIVWP